MSDMPAKRGAAKVANFRQVDKAEECQAWHSMGLTRMPSSAASEG